jgi:hypothetical protein
MPPFEEDEALRNIQRRVQQFTNRDAVEGGAAAQVWPTLIENAYPQLAGKHLSEQLILLIVRTVQNRQGAQDIMDFVEYNSGKGNLTWAHILAGLNGCRLDLIHDKEQHDCLKPCGLRLWLDKLANLHTNGLAWQAPRCSSWITLCKYVHNRRAENGFYGNTNYEFVREGNMQMQVASLVFFVAASSSLSPVLEQPLTSVMVKCCPLSTVLACTGAIKTVVWHGAFGGKTPKPLQLWHVHPSYRRMSERGRPSFKGSAKLVRRHGCDGKKFTGGKHVTKSQAYSKEFGTAVAKITRRNLLEQR